MEKIPQTYRQGDVVLRRIDRIPKDCKKAKDCIVAYGEATGHAHRFETGAKQLIRTTPQGTTQYIRVMKERAELLHHEHGTIEVPKGDYEVVHQREYEPQGNLAVID